MILLPTVLWLPLGEVGMTEEMNLAWMVIIRGARVETAGKRNKHGGPEGSQIHRARAGSRPWAGALTSSSSRHPSEEGR